MLEYIRNVKHCDFHHVYHRIFRCFIHIEAHFVELESYNISVIKEKKKKKKRKKKEEERRRRERRKKKKEEERRKRKRKKGEKKKKKKGRKVNVSHRTRH